MTSGKRKSTKVGLKMVELSVMPAKRLKSQKIMAQVRVNVKNA